MYVVTFYSYKGGVGRTLALVNVACALAASGRRVLLVDFDLEAPGIETFPMLQAEHDTPGVVDFVSEYQKTHATPDVREYVYQVDLPSTSASSLWVMPAGRRDDGYGARLNGIDWQRLYAEHDGYLMFEDLKAQWREVFKPDYVLIDSRTGHTDVGGICTRQLPDAVAILFFPNDQNLLGLQKVVGDIRRQPRPEGARPIELHFVTSNVPDLDDEDSILAERMRRFRSTLEYRKLAATIHHYDSLALLNQAVFTLERPRSRLSGEFQELLKRITTGNPRDRAGALLFLKEAGRRSETLAAIRQEDEDARFKAIKEFHSKDAEVLFSLGHAMERRGSLADALDFYAEAEKYGLHTASLFIRRARLLRIIGVDAQAPTLLETAGKVLQCEDASYEDVDFAVAVLRRGAAVDGKNIARSEAVRRLPDSERWLLLRQLQFESTRDALEAFVEDLLRGTTAAQATTTELQKWTLALALIALSRFGDAKELLAVDRLKLQSRSISDVFNAAIAEWGECGTPPIDLFEEVIRQDSANPPTNTNMRLEPNYEQCLALSYASVGNQAKGLERSTHAKKLAHELSSIRGAEIFSCWRFSYVDRREFLVDTEEIEKFAQGVPVSPRFLNPRREKK